MLRRFFALPLMVVLTPVTPLMAEIYKCTGADGKIVFSDQPCATGQKAVVIKPQNSAAPTPPTTEQTTKFYDRAIALAAKKLENPQYKEECTVVGQRKAGVRKDKDKVGQRTPADEALFEQRVAECEKWYQEYMGTIIAREEHLAKEKRKENAATAPAAAKKSDYR
jgi:hypothetical protein